MTDDLEKFTVKAMSEYLTGMGIYPNTAGYTYILESVCLAVKRGLRGLSICKLYADVGKDANKSGAAVERAIRNAICKCTDEGRMNTINEYFGHTVYSDRFPMRAGELICLFASKIIGDYVEIYEEYFSKSR